MSEKIMICILFLIALLVSSAIVYGYYECSEAGGMYVKGVFGMECIL